MPMPDPSQENELVKLERLFKELRMESDRLRSAIDALQRQVGELGATSEASPPGEEAGTESKK